MNYEVNSDLSRFCAIADEDQAWTVYNSRELCGTIKLSGEPQLGLHFEPRCLYVVIASNSRRDLFNELLVRPARPRAPCARRPALPVRRPPGASSPTRST